MFASYFSRVHVSLRIPWACGRTIAPGMVRLRERAISPDSALGAGRLESKQTRPRIFVLVSFTK